MSGNIEMEDLGTKFSPKKTKSKRFCSVFGCSSKACKNPEVRFHQFPLPKKGFVKVVNKSGSEEMIDRRKQWETVLKMGKKVTSNMCVCSLHFKNEDYSFPTDSCTGKRYLKVTAVPSCNLPKSTIDTWTKKLQKNAKSKSREERRINRETTMTENYMLNKEASESLSAVQIGKCEVIDKLYNASRSCGIQDSNILTENGKFAQFLENVEENTEDSKVLHLIDKGIQVKSGDLVDFNFSACITTDKELSTATGIPNFKVLDMFIKIVERVAPRLAFYTGKLTVRDRIILTFMRIKQNVSYAFLNILFKTCSERHISNVICNILDILGNALKPEIVFPTREEILKNIPFCFQEYTDVSLILDCTEIEIQKPQSLCCQLLTYSFYKSRFTIKFLTACTPGGLLAYVSPAYGGRSSDKAIFEQSGIIETLEKSEKIMVDKGFLIDDLCVQHGIKVVRPPFLRNKSQLSQTEALNTGSIASARVHIERLNQRLKVFQILGSKMPSCLVKKCENIMTVIAAVVNLSLPILSDERFPT